MQPQGHRFIQLIHSLTIYGILDYITINNITQEVDNLITLPFPIIFRVTLASQYPDHDPVLWRG
ncbi:hypothetical protein HanXRQr2_Chr06g0247241 [Helianthus annuus]|uniref:Uncharacterized protein n=1 Tax=Helianthus annuus TaxID=4232 RepID=A0A251UH40_HELAN|nr:hypothetical protein HanXRQr2_Chr06g0247241 [Helianthus annuus]